MTKIKQSNKWWIYGRDRQFSQSKVQMANKHIKSLYHSHQGDPLRKYIEIPSPPFRVAIIKKTNDSGCW